MLIAHRARMQANPDKVRQRPGAIEHPFGTLKRRAGWDHFLMRGNAKVRGEMSLRVLCYNFTRVLNMLGMAQFIEHINAKATSCYSFIQHLIGLLSDAVSQTKKDKRIRRRAIRSLITLLAHRQLSSHASTV